MNFSAIGISAIAASAMLLVGPAFAIEAKTVVYKGVAGDREAACERAKASAKQIYRSRVEGFGICECKDIGSSRVVIECKVNAYIGKGGMFD